MARERCPRCGGALWHTDDGLACFSCARPVNPPPPALPKVGRTRAPGPEHHHRDHREATGLPEDSAYGDTGCDLHPSCLSCPVPVGCRYELEPGQARRYTDALRLRRVLVDENVSLQEAAERFGVSRRTICRWMALFPELVDVT